MKDESLENIMYLVWLGVYNINSLPIDMYVVYFGEFISNWNKGYGTPENEDEAVYNNAIRENINEFSAAKTAFYINTLLGLLYKDGVKLDFDSFKKAAKNDNTLNLINSEWTKVEVETINAYAESKRNYDNIIRLYGKNKLVTYTTRRDERVRDSHRLLDGFTFEIGDPKYAFIIPPIDWNCRCKLTVAGNDKKKTDKVQFLKNINNSGNEVGSLKDLVGDDFKHSITSGYVFGKNTSYFESMLQYDKGNNFNLGYL